MKNIGSMLLFFGVGSIVLGFFGYDFRLVSWVDMWGETTGWAIRGGVIAAGAGLFFLGWRADQESSPEAAPAPRQEPTMQAQAPADAPAAPAAPASAEMDTGSDPMGTMRNS